MSHINRRNVLADRDIRILLRMVHNMSLDLVHNSGNYRDPNLVVQGHTYTAKMEESVYEESLYPIPGK